MQRKIFILILLSIILINTNENLLSQNVTAKSSVDTNNVLIGDWIKLKLSVSSSQKLNITWPQIPDSIGKIEILSRTKIDTNINEKGITFTQNLVITSFDSGKYFIPSFTFMFEKKGITSLFPVSTDSIALSFNTVAVDTSQAIKDIKPVMEEPLSFWEIFPWIMAGLGIIVLAVIGYFIWKRMKSKPKEVLDYDPKIPPHIIALVELEKLENEKLWQKGQVKLYYVRLTDIVRTYIERRFLVPALEITTSEIVVSLKETEIDNYILNRFAEVLKRADLVKFAKFQPLPDENSLSMSESVKFVNDTIPQADIILEQITGAKS